MSLVTRGILMAHKLCGGSIRVPYGSFTTSQPGARDFCWPKDSSDLGSKSQGATKIDYYTENMHYIQISINNFDLNITNIH